MIEKMKMRFGSSAAEQPLEIEVAPMTVFVGPNNSGKSKVLKEIEGYCKRGQQNVNDLILDQLTFKSLEGIEREEFQELVTLEPNPTEVVRPGHITIGKDQKRHHIDESQFNACLDDATKYASTFCSCILQHYTLILDGRNRIGLVSEQAAGDLQAPPSNFLDILLRNDGKREEVRRILYDAFGAYFVVDPTRLGRLRIRFSDVKPKNFEQERRFDDEAVAFYGAATEIEQFSDGVKAFTGMLTQIISGDPLVLLIDEPEAFLHPALSYKLGKEVASSASHTNKSVFVSTHSASFIMGCVQSGAHTNIVRLTYQNGVATARTLPTDKLLELMRKPLLRSTGVLDGLFYEAVVVTESDTDRAFYGEINSRLQNLSPPRGINNCLFLHAQNKQTVQEIIRPLREMGIPAAGIVDVDILKDGGKVWTGFLGAGNVPEALHDGLGQTRSKIHKCCEISEKNMKKDGGINILNKNDKAAANDLFDQLESYGLFVVRGGEIESWMKELKVAGHGPTWLVSMFERMGYDPADGKYVKPADDDVWAFMDSIGVWLKNPNRKGIPD